MLQWLKDTCRELRVFAPDNDALLGGAGSDTLAGGDGIDISNAPAGHNFNFGYFTEPKPKAKPE